MPFCKQFWRPWATVALAVGASGALCVAQAKSPDDKPSRSAKSVKAASKAEQVGKVDKAARKAAKSGKPAVARVSGKALPHTDAEDRLLKVIDLVRQQKLNAALQAAAQLTADVPNFQAAQLVYADLLRYKTGHAGALPATPVAGTHTVAPAQAAAPVLVKHALLPEPAAATPNAMEQLHGLQDEIRRRVQGAALLPATGSVPAEFLALAPTVRQAIAIDASKSRLYLFSHQDGKLQLTGDYYVTVGKLGMGKFEEGDQRTPEGMYFVGRQIAGAKLPDFYGKGALTVNYPNDWDKAMGRSGSGIWLHGTPPEQYARLPLASDGCMVLSNTDLLHLMRTVDRFSPVLVRERLHWVPPADAAQARDRDAFIGVLTHWQQSWNKADAAAVQQLQTSDWRASDTGKAMNDRMAAAFKSGKTSLENISVYAWKDAQGEIRVTNFRLKSSDLGQPLSLRQYWRKAGNEWKLFSEDNQS